MPSKNHTISKIVARTCVRVLVILLAFSLYILYNYSDSASQTLHFQNYWSIIAPLVLFFTVITLMILTLRFKYSKTDLNWLFSFACVFFAVYLSMLYSRIYPLL